MMLSSRYPVSRLFLLAAVLCLPFSAMSQGRKKKKAKEEEDIPVFNYVIDDPMDVFGRQATAGSTFKTVLLPDICMHAGVFNDTIYRYEYYNAAHELINPDTLTNYRDLKFISLLRGYTDTEHTYKDASGVQQPLPVSRIINRYDRIGSNKWLCVDYLNNKTGSLTEDTGDIIHRDTVAGSNGSSIVRSYYRTAPAK